MGSMGDRLWSKTAHTIVVRKHSDKGVRARLPSQVIFPSKMPLTRSYLLTANSGVKFISR